MAGKPRGDGNSQGRKAPALDRLKPHESAAVLRRLLDAHPDLLKEAEGVARTLLKDVEFEAVAGEVEDSLLSFDLDELNGRAGGHSWGYVGPDEAACEILEVALEPFIEDLKRQMELGLEAEALESLKGIMLGLYRVRDERENEVLGYAGDFPVDAAGQALEVWRNRGDTKSGARRGSRPRRALPADFVNRFLPQWRSWIERDR